MWTTWQGFFFFDKRQPDKDVFWVWPINNCNFALGQEDCIYSTKNDGLVLWRGKEVSLHFFNATFPPFRTTHWNETPRRSEIVFLYIFLLLSFIFIFIFFPNFATTHFLNAGTPSLTNMFLSLSQSSRWARKPRKEKEDGLESWGRRIDRLGESLLAPLIDIPTLTKVSRWTPN